MVEARLLTLREATDAPSMFDSEAEAEVWLYTLLTLELRPTVGVEYLRLPLMVSARPSLTLNDRGELRSGFSSALFGRTKR